MGALPGSGGKKWDGASRAFNALQMTLATVAERRGMTFIDHTRMLSVEQFSDAVHPFQTGRDAWSQALGLVLQPSE